MLDLAAIYTQLRHPLIGFISRRVGCPFLAEDLCQETFYKAWRALAAGTDVQYPDDWLYQIATNLIIDHKRLKRNAESQTLKEWHSVDAGWEESVINVTVANECLALLADIAERQATAVRLRYVEQYDRTEIGELLSITPGNANRLRYAGIQALRHKVQERKLTP